MPLTLAVVQTSIVNRIGGKMQQAFLTLVADGTNPVLMDACRDALLYVGVVPADPATVTDADLAKVPARRVKTYTDAAILEALYVVAGRMPDAFDQRIQGNDQKLHQIMDDLAALINEYKAKVPKLNTPGMAAGAGCGVPIPNDAFNPPVSYAPFPYRPFNAPWAGG